MGTQVLLLLVVVLLVLLVLLPLLLLLVRLVLVFFVLQLLTPTAGHAQTGEVSSYSARELAVKKVFDDDGELSDAGEATWGGFVPPSLAPMQSGAYCNDPCCDSLSHLCNSP